MKMRIIIIIQTTLFCNNLILFQNQKTKGKTMLIMMIMKMMNQKKVLNKLFLANYSLVLLVASPLAKKINKIAKIYSPFLIMNINLQTNIVPTLNNPKKIQ